MLAEPGYEEAVARVLAESLTAPTDARRRWDQIDLCGIEKADRATELLAAALAERGHAVDRLSAPSCWRIALPDTWEGYLARLSKNRRRQVHRMERTFLETGRARLHTVEQVDELPPAMERLAALHTLRRRSMGQRGAFASPAFAAFHAEMVRELLATGRLHLHWLEVDGRAVATEYDLVGGLVVYAYQSGIDPLALEMEPGNLLNVLVLRRAIALGYRHYDYLRGDEPYKAHWRAEPRECVHLRITARSWPARLRRVARHVARRWRHCLEPGRPAEPPSHEAQP